MEEQRAQALATSLLGGVGQAHRAANVDNALPPFTLVIPPTPDKGTTEFISDPIKVVEFYAAP